MKTTDTKKTGNGTKSANAQLAALNQQIEDLKLQKLALAEPMKQRRLELASEILQVEADILELDPTWRPSSLRPKVDDKITEILTTNGQPMTVESIIEAVGSVFSPWKIKSVLKKRSSGAKSIFTFAENKYSLKAA